MERGSGVPRVTQEVSTCLSQDPNRLLASGGRSFQASRAFGNRLTLRAPLGFSDSEGALRRCADGWEDWTGRAFAPGKWDSWGGTGKDPFKMPESQSLAVFGLESSFESSSPFYR